MEDLELFLSKERAKHCFEILDFDSNGKVRKSELSSKLVAIESLLLVLYCVVIPTFNLHIQ